MNQRDEYPPEGRFGWDFVLNEMTHAELDEMADCVEIGDEDGAEAVIARAERRVFCVA